MGRRGSLQVALAAGMATFVCYSSASASNTGFKLRMPLPFDASQATPSWVSLPYRYWPNGNVGQAPQNSLDVCADLNGARQNSSKVALIGKWNTTVESLSITSCSSKTSFPIVVGEGYVVRPAGPGITIELIGAHDDRYAPNKAPAPNAIPLTWVADGSNNNLVSVPYHAMARNSLDLCAELNEGVPASRIESISTLDAVRHTPRVQPCAGKFKAFDLVPGQAYSLKPAASGVAIGFKVW